MSGSGSVRPIGPSRSRPAAPREAALGPDAEPRWIAAALLHDVGKAETRARARSAGSAATVIAARRRPRTGPALAERGSGGMSTTTSWAPSVLQAAGARPEAVAWARAHHRPDRAGPRPASPPEICRDPGARPTENRIRGELGRTSRRYTDVRQPTDSYFVRLDVAAARAVTRPDDARAGRPRRPRARRARVVAAPRAAAGRSGAGGCSSRCWWSGSAPGSCWASQQPGRRVGHGQRLDLAHVRGDVAEREHRPRSRNRRGSYFTAQYVATTGRIPQLTRVRPRGGGHRRRRQRRLVQRRRPS